MTFAINKNFFRTQRQPLLAPAEFMLLSCATVSSVLSKYVPLYLPANFPSHLLAAVGTQRNQNLPNSQVKHKI